MKQIQKQEKQDKTETLFYLDMWNNEEQQNDKAKNKSFEHSQQDDKVIREQEKKDFKEVIVKKLGFENPNATFITQRIRG